mmetsp:Transcript_24372/g.30516  ORF Transcript_24372/g.30516 Transcript_24372/m.30516 type:complete len:347 (+) Transcript_24372:1-1041(+)
MLGTPDFVLSNLAKNCLHKNATASILFWKNLTMSGFAFAAAAAEKKDYDFIKCTSFHKKIWYYCIIISTRSIVQISLSVSFLLTYAANANLLFSTNGLWSALLGWLILKESLAKQTKIALVLATLSIAGMTLPDILFSNNKNTTTSNFGDALALLAAIALSIFYITARKAPADIHVSFAVAVGTFLAAVFTGIFSIITTKEFDFFRTSAHSNATRIRFFSLTLTNGFLLGLLVIVFAIAPRFISGAKIGLICLSQNITSPLLAFFVLHQVPPVATLIGGACVLFIVTVHEYWHVTQSNKTMMILSTDQDLQDNDSSNLTTAIYQPLSSGALIIENHHNQHTDNIIV